MRVTVKFDVAPSVRIHDPWPIVVEDKTLFLEVSDDGHLNSAAVVYTGVPVSEAPQASENDSGGAKLNITVKDSYRLDAERALRAWQSLLAIYAYIPIDYDSGVTSYHAETVSEESQIQITSFSSFRNGTAIRNHDDFTIYARAFVALDEGFPTIEPMAFFIDGTRALQAGRAIDAYNYFYLFLEAYFGIPSGTREAVKRLLSISEVRSAVRETARESLLENPRVHLRFSNIDPYNEQGLIKEIVELRGFLRHNSLRNPARWDANRQHEFAQEARFIALIAQGIAAPITFDLTWKDQYAGEVLRQAKESNSMTQVHVILTIKEEDRVRDVMINMNFPQPSPNAALAAAVLKNTLAIFDERSPGAELFAVRAMVKDTGRELFRYDLGPSLAR